jgi:hypothetical protein
MLSKGKAACEMKIAAGLCISPIFALRYVSEMQNWYSVHLSNSHIISTHCWIANIIVLLAILGNLDDVRLSDRLGNCVHDQQTLTGKLDFYCC